MKKILFSVLIFSIAGTGIFFSRRKDTVTTSNTPPVANAGPDQTIFLPTDSVELIGSERRALN